MIQLETTRNKRYVDSKNKRLIILSGQQSGNINVNMLINAVITKVSDLRACVKGSYLTISDVVVVQMSHDIT